MSGVGLVAGLLSPTLALAHEGHHETMAAAQALRHLLTQPDHEMMLAGLVVLLVAGAWQWRRAKARK